MLQFFPAHTHPLTLVHDPDGLLADEGLLAALAERGFTLIQEPDPVRLRHRVEQARPWSADHPLIIVTAEPLNKLPYDLWQQGHHISLALHAFFPHLAYPVVRTLTPSQRWQLSQVPAPVRPLGRQGSTDHILRHVFNVDLNALQQPAGLITWLNGYHQRAEPMSSVLLDHLLAHLGKVPAYVGWPLDELLASREAFTTFVRQQWRAYVQQQTGQLLSEEPVCYVLSFETDPALQDTLPSLVRSGTLEPVVVDCPERLPRWVLPVVVTSDEDRLARRFDELLQLLQEYARASLPEARWPHWEAMAHLWVELVSLRYDPRIQLDLTQETAYQQLQSQLDKAFLDWLRRRYAPLGSQRVPTPHHVHHVPHYIAYQRRQGRVDRVALFVLDSMSLADWQRIGSTWRARHPDWRFEEHLLLAQVPTITAVSRQALVSGLRPADFAATLDSNRSETKQWAAFWAAEGVPGERCAYAHLALDRGEKPPVVDDPRFQALCVVDSTIDEIVHGASLGAANVQASLQLWLDRQSQQLEELIADLLTHGFAFYLVSDHGHAEARGMGQPAEGLAVDSRGQRARLYSDRRAAENVQRTFTETILWGQDGLLPDGMWALIPLGRKAFATTNETVVTHGGLSIEEVIVPLVRITRD